MTNTNGTLKYRVGEVEKRVGRLDDKVDLVMENHLPHIQQTVKEIQTDVGWLKKWFWLVAGTSLGGLVTGLMNLIV